MTATSTLSPASSRVAPAVVGANAVDSRTKAKLWNASVDFETQYLSSMLQPMFDSVEVDETFGGGHGEEMFRSLLTNEYAKQIAGRGVGLAENVYRELLSAQEKSHG